MAWQPTPTDSKGAWKGYEFCLFAIPNGWMDTPELVLIYRTKNDSQWLSVGAGDGSVYAGASFQSYADDVQKAGGFEAWWPPIRAEINKRLTEKCAQLEEGTPQSITTPLGNPETFTEFQSWLKANVAWSGAASVPVTSGDIWGNRIFLNGYAIEDGIRLNADGSIERISRINVPNVGWKPIGWTL